MQITNTKQSLLDLMDEKVQFSAIGSFLDFDINNFEFILLYTEAIVFIYAYNHEKMNKEKQLKLNDIVKYPFIDREKGSGTRDILENQFKRYNELKHKLIMMNNENIISAVSNSDNISLISEISAKKAENAKLIKIIYLLDVPPIKRDLYFVKKKGVKHANL